MKGKVMANYNGEVRRQLKRRKGNFTQFPNEIFDAAISPKAKLIWIYLVSLQRDRDICQAYISKKFGISKGAMKSIIKELTQNKLVEVKRKGPRSDYTVKQVPKELLPKSIDDIVLDQDELTSVPCRDQNDPSKDQKIDSYKYKHAILNTSERTRSGRCSKSSSLKDHITSPSKNSKTPPNIDSPDSRLQNTSEWYQWLINKHAKVQFHFPTLPYEERLKWATKYGIGCDKEQFLDEYLRHYNLIGGLLPETLDI